MTGRVLGVIGAVLAAGLLIWYFFFTEAIPGFWTLDEEASSFHFTSVKNGDIAEQHSIKNLSGEADYSGTFRIRLDLASLETGIAIRDERMREFLFETARYPVATIKGTFELNQVSGLEPGQDKVILVPFSLDLHGVEKDMEAEVRVFRQTWKKVIVNPAEEIVVLAEDFKLRAGLDTLRGIAGLDSISSEVPVTFELVFEGSTTP